MAFAAAAETRDSAQGFDDARAQPEKAPDVLVAPDRRGGRRLTWRRTVPLHELENV
jgi:hypothetical protein